MVRSLRTISFPFSHTVLLPLLNLCKLFADLGAIQSQSQSQSQPEQDLPRPHTALRQGRRRLAGTDSRMGTASCSSLCLCNCSLASICICDGPLAVFHNCAVVRRSSRLLLVAASLGVALLRCCCCCCRAFFRYVGVGNEIMRIL